MKRGKLFWLGTVLPSASLLVIALVFHLFIRKGSSADVADLILGAVLVGGTIAYSWFMTRWLGREQEKSERSYQIIRRQRDALEAIQEATYAMISQGDVVGLLRQLTEATRTLTNAEGVVLCLAGDNEEGGPAGYLAERHASRILDSDTIGDLPLCLAQGTAGPFTTVPDPAILQRLFGLAPSGGVRLRPLTYDGTVLGYLIVVMPQNGMVEDDGTPVLDLLANHAAMLLGRERLRQRLARLDVLEERHRIGLDLHDRIVQVLYGINLQLDSLAGEAERRAPGVARQLDRVIDVLDKLLEDVRRYAYALQSANINVETAIRETLANIPGGRNVQVEISEGQHRLGTAHMLAVMYFLRALVPLAHGSDSVRIAWSIIPAGADAGREGFVRLTLSPQAIAAPAWESVLEELRERLAQLDPGIRLEHAWGTGRDLNASLRFHLPAALRERTVTAP
ncbi:protein of unknown function [Candidatus Hydrogenisulfobacillus filiaventi]|uniref:histidine kinase n=1 Tax=Candidatus Hydrogenisulfobacillus filiaventi TaxID=2707344 RepID=A0A6F8ZFV3_9FIRM|nr:histidine kinase [Bacillota bacterium]CAB1128814.1 protein of unknown function [Candidatus Hydrogenisulfobacillus filiaventi]